MFPKGTLAKLYNTCLFIIEIKIKTIKNRKIEKQLQKKIRTGLWERREDGRVVNPHSFRGARNPPPAPLGHFQRWKN